MLLWIKIGVDKVNNILSSNVLDKFKGAMMNFGTSVLPKIIAALIIVVAGLIVIKIIKRIVRKALVGSKAQLDISLINFVVRAIGICLKVVLVLSALATIGISTTGIIAAFSACAVAISLALKDSLGNIAGGIMMLISQPFSTGDFIDVDGSAGTVLKIDMVHTTLLTPDNRQVVIPNGQLMNKTITDYSKEATRRMDLKFSIGYDDDAELAVKIITDVVSAHEFTLKDPAPFIRVTEYADSAVVITARAWCESANYWSLHFDLLEQVKKEFDKNGITIPYNQLDVHVVDKK